MSLWLRLRDSAPRNGIHELSLSFNEKKTILYTDRVGLNSLYENIVLVYEACNVIHYLYIVHPLSNNYHSRSLYARVYPNRVQPLRHGLLSNRLWDSQNDVIGEVDCLRPGRTLRTLSSSFGQHLPYLQIASYYGQQNTCFRQKQLLPCHCWGGQPHQSSWSDLSFSICQ